jgi:tetratricopeptide (TPR) repeat protein
VKVEGKPIKAGTYGLHMAVWQDSVVVIFSNQTEAWGSFYYDEKYDALRVTVKPVMLDKSVEYLKYEFIEHKEKHCVVALQWEKWSIPFKIEVDVENIIVNRLREQATSQKGFNALNLVAAANYCIGKNINLEEALGWAQRAAGTKAFPTLNTLGTAYTKLNRLKEADSTMNEALVFANPNQHIAYARSLITAKRIDRALEVLLANQKKHGDVVQVNMGLSLGYSAKGDYKKALTFAEKALAQATSDAAKKTMQDNIDKLKQGKDINQ